MHVKKRALYIGRGVANERSCKYRSKLGIWKVVFLSGFQEYRKKIVQSFLFTMSQVSCVLAYFVAFLSNIITTYLGVSRNNKGCSFFLLVLAHRYTDMKSIIFLYRFGCASSIYKIFNLLCAWFGTKKIKK